MGSREARNPRFFSVPRRLSSRRGAAVVTAEPLQPKEKRPMTQLTDAQSILLSKAAGRGDDAAILPTKMPKSAAMKVGASLVAKKLMREVRAKGDMPVWREDDQGRRYSLVLTRAGRDAIGVTGEREVAAEGNAPYCEPAANENTMARVKAKAVRGGKSSSEIDAGPPRDCGEAAILESASTKKHSASPPLRSAATNAAPRAGSKQALVIDMLSKEDGATLDQLIAATGWLPHTTRAALTGLRKRGFEIARTPRESGGSLYRIMTASAARS